LSLAAQRLLIAFDGEVECRRPSGAINLSLHGRERDGTRGATRAVEVLMAAAVLAAELPPRLNDVSVLAADAHHLQIRARELQQELTCHSVQVHRNVGGAFFAAVPPARVPLMVRLGWTLLLGLLRLPGAEALLKRMRGIR
jgi:hypothetical protein